MNPDFRDMLSAFCAEGVEFVDVDIGGLTVPVLSRDLLIRNKRASGRPQDVADVAWLEGRA